MAARATRPGSNMLLVLMLVQEVGTDTKDKKEFLWESKKKARIDFG